MRICGVEIDDTRVHQLCNAALAMMYIHKTYSDPSSSLISTLPFLLMHSVEAVFPRALPNEVMILANTAKALQSGYAFLSRLDPDEVVDITSTTNTCPAPRP